MKLFFFFYHSSNLLLLVSPVLFLVRLLPISLFMACFIGKLIADSVLIAASVRIFESYQFRRTFTIFEALYVLYNTIIGPLGLFRRFEWKPS